MSNGVFALFGVTLSSTQRSIESFASSFNMPYVTPSAPTPSWTTARRNATAAFTLYIRPTYHRAVIDVVRVYRWTKIYYIYDDNDGTSRVCAAPPPSGIISRGKVCGTLFALLKSCRNPWKRRYRC